MRTGTAIFFVGGSWATQPSSLWYVGVSFAMRRFGRPDLSHTDTVKRSRRRTGPRFVPGQPGSSPGRLVALPTHFGKDQASLG
jgi:hypothetical protein